MRQFKASAACHSHNSSSTSNPQLVQVIADKFDRDLCTLNGMKQTHALAPVICTIDEEQSSIIPDIPCLKHEHVCPSDRNKISYV